MTFGNFLAAKVNSQAIVKVIWPEETVIGCGRPAEYFNETSMLAANVFDFMIADPETGYNVIVWLTRSKETMFDL